MQRYLIITAGGTGVRMKAGIPKQFLLLNDLPILFHTLNAFTGIVQPENTVLVLPGDQMEEWNKLRNIHFKNTTIKAIAGGLERFHSVQNGLKEIKGDGVVAIHDGVRPLVSKAVIETCYKLAEACGSAIPVIPINESLRILEKEESRAVDRRKYRVVQTPQCFNLTLIKNAYKQPFKPEFTDDASVFEASGGKIYLTDGNIENIKITTKFDLAIAEALKKNPEN